MDKVLSWLSGFFQTANLFTVGQAIWNGFMGLVNSLLSTSAPESLAPDAWKYITTTAYPWFLSAASVLMNLFFMIGFIRQCTNLRENVTIEMWIELIIKVIVANALMVNGISLMQSFLTLAGDIKDVFYPAGSTINITPEKVGTVELVISSLVFGVIYMIGAFICGGIILIEVFARFLNLYLLITVAPVALSTLAGGRGLENTAYAWIKSFLTNTFQIVVIALVLKIGGLMISNWDFVSNGNFDMFDGFESVIASFAEMVLITTAVKGSDKFLTRAFDLR